MATLKFLQTRLSLLTSFQEMIPTESFVAMKRKTLVNECLRKLGGQTHLSFAEGQSILDYLKAAQLPEKDQTALSEAVANLVTPAEPKHKPAPLLESDHSAQVPLPQASSAPSPDPLALPKYQVHHSFQQYLTKEDWLVLANAAQPCHHQVAVLGNAMHRCGWVWYSENGLADVIGTLGPLGIDVAGYKGLALVHQLKKYLDSAVKGLSPALTRKALGQGAATVWVFPANPKELPEPWRTLAFAEGELIPAPFAADRFHHYRAQVPARKTHWTVKAEEQNLRLGSASFSRSSLAPASMPALEDSSEFRSRVAIQASPLRELFLARQAARHPVYKGELPQEIQAQELATRSSLQGSAIQGHQNSECPITLFGRQPAQIMAGTTQPQQAQTELSPKAAVASQPALEDAKAGPPGSEAQPPKNPGDLQDSVAEHLNASLGMLGKKAQAEEEVKKRRCKAPASPKVKKTTTKATTKSKTSSAQPQPKPKAKPKASSAQPKPKPKAKPKVPGKLVLGCCKCRRSPTGCAQCKNPAFGGRRGGPPVPKKK